MAEAATLPRADRGAFPWSGLAAAVAGIVIWQVAAVVIGNDALAGPVPAVRRLGELLSEPRYRPDIYSTVVGFLAALALSWVLGLAGAAWFGLRGLAGDVAEPLLVSFYSIPKLTLYPIILLIFGLGMPSKVTFGVIHGVVPVILIGMAAIRNLRPVYLRTARVMRLSRREALLHVLFPAVLPELVNAMRIGLSLTLLGTLIGEMFGGKGGLGFMLIRAINLADNDTIMAIALLLLVFSVSANWALGRVVRYLSNA